MQSLVFNLTATLPLESMNVTSINYPVFANGSFGYPAALRDLRAPLSDVFDLTPYVGLRSLEVTVDFPLPTFLPALPPTLESFRIRSGYHISLTEFYDLVSNLPNIKSLNLGVIADAAELSLGSGTIVSESIETLTITFAPSQYNYLMTINSSSLKSAELNSFGPLALNTPNLEQLTVSAFYNLPTGFNQLYRLEELRLSQTNVSALALANLDWAVNLTSLAIGFWTVDSSELTTLLCNLPTNNPKLSSLSLSYLSAPSPGLIFELPACLAAARQLKFFNLAGYRYSPNDYAFRASSAATALPSTIETLKISNELDDDTSIYNFSQFRRLKELYLSSSSSAQFVGEMDDFFSFYPTLEKLTISSIGINGTIPSTGWATMRWIELMCSCTQWTGLDSAPFLSHIAIASSVLETIPNDVDLRKLQELEWFDLQPSQGAQITTPSFWTRLPKVFSVIIYANFSGPITTPIAAPRLVSLMLVGGEACGPLPDFEIPMTLQTLSIANNRFSGTIPQSWATNLNIRREISLANNLLSGTIPSGFLNRKMVNFQTLALENNYFSGPVWTTHNYPWDIFDLSYNNFNICDSLPTSYSTMTINTCTFSNVPICPDSTPVCLGFWQSLCLNTYQCSLQSEVRALPLSQECIAPVNPAINDLCPPPGPPGFTCINGQWVSSGSVTLPSITLPRNGGVIVVNGNLSTSGSLTFDGIGSSIVVEGCVENLPSEITIILKGDEKLKTTNLLTQKGSDCANDLSTIPVSLVQDKNNCKQVKLSTKESTRSSLIVVFDLDSHKCNTKWIVLGSVLGGIIVLLAAGVAIGYHLSPRFRTFLRTCSTKKHPN